MDKIHHVIMYQLQEVALLFLAMIYFFRLTWLHQRFRASRDIQPRGGRPGTGPVKGAIYSMGVLSRPWHLESARKHPFLYSQFIFFHLGVAAAIALSIILPYAPQWLSWPPLPWTLGVFIGMGFISSLLRFYRRATNSAMRAINTFDDYFSLGLLAIWLFLAFFVVGIFAANIVIRDAFFLLTAFFLFYVPFSKISHYLYYPFSRYLLGRTLGWRGVYPLAQVPVFHSSKPRSKPRRIP
jgi:hypothetical protein